MDTQKIKQFKLLLLGIFLISAVFLFEADIASAANCGGGVQCACGDTITASTQTNDIVDLTCLDANGLIIGANSIVVDGEGHTISGNVFSYGIYASGRTNITIKNFNISGFSEGLNLTSVTSSNIQDNTLTANIYYGINSILSSSLTITGNTIINCGIGISINGNSNNLTNNNISDGDAGIYLSSSSSNILTGNQMSGNISGYGNLYIVDDFDNTINTTNTVEGKPVYYLYNHSDETYDGNIVGDIGMFWCISCTNVILRNATLAANNYYGVYFDGTTNSSIQNIIADYNIYYGIYLGGTSNGNTLTGNSARFNAEGGIVLSSSSSNALTNNIANNSYGHGILLSSSNSNTLDGNTANSNDSSGIYISSSSSNTLTGNNMSDNGLSGNLNININFSNTIDTTNTVGGKPVLYLNDVHGTLGAPLIYSGNSSDSGVYAGDIGMFWCINCSYITLKNATLSPNNYYGVYFNGTDNSTIENVVANSARSGVYLESSDSNVITGSVFSFNQYGVFLSDSVSNNITNNKISFNLYGSSLSPSNTFDTNKVVSNSYDFQDGLISYNSNEFFHNKSSGMLTFEDVTRTVNVGQEIGVTFSMFSRPTISCSASTTPSCSYTAVASPSEEVATVVNGNQVTASFTPSRRGIYSLVFTVTDSNLNKTERLVTFMVGATSSTTTRYYLRGTNTTHSQMKGNGGDSKSLTLTPPTSVETWRCSEWVQNSPDNLPNYPVSLISGITLFSWYKSQTEGSFIAERYTTYGAGGDSYLSNSASDDFIWVGPVSFTDLNWQMDYPQSWYWMALKLFGTAPVWKTTAAQPSYADFTYSYTTIPAVKSISNEDINLLSATADPDALSNVSIVLENPFSATTSTNVVIDKWDTDKTRPFLNATTTTILSTGATATATTSVNADSSKTLTSVPLDITPNTGSIDVSVVTWNDSGDYSKEWIETGNGVTSAEHTVGDLQAGSDYTVSVDGQTMGAYQANESGAFTFNYTSGYSSHTFKVTPGTFVSGGSFVSSTPALIPQSQPQQPQWTVDALQAEIARLMKLIAELSGKPTPPTTPTPTSFQFTKVLQLGDNDPQVKQLQQFLNAKGFTVAQTGLGSPGNETTMFGHATRNALIKFQEAYAEQILKPLGLTKGTGKFARMTIMVVNGMVGK